MKKFECDNCTNRHCYTENTQNDIPEKCLFDGRDTNWQRAKIYPALTVEALAERGIEWPDGAECAMVYSDGKATFCKSRMTVDEHGYFQSSIPVADIPGVWDTEKNCVDWRANWFNYIVKRPAVVKQNLTTEPPEWCRVGAWVYSAALRTEFARITGPGKTSETLSAVTAEGFKCIVLVDKQAISCGATKPARVRPWTFGEAPESVKTAENSEYLECCWHLNGIFKGEPSFFCWKDNFISASKMAETMTQLDGSPCGVLEVVE